MGQALIEVDSRTGSKELAEDIRRCGVATRLVTLDAADFAFDGIGAGGRPVRIGIERKTISDFIGSCRSDRLAAEQLPKLRAGYTAVWLVLEGLWRQGDGGLLEVWRRGSWEPYSYGGASLAHEVVGREVTLTVKGGVHFWRTGTPAETARYVVSLYHWWTLGGGYDSHRSHHGIEGMQDELLTLGQVGRTAATLPGIGKTRAVYVQERFRTIREMVDAGLGAWSNIAWPSAKGKRMRLGIAAASKVRAAIEGEEG